MVSALPLKVAASNETKIEKGVPLPSKVAPNGRYPFGTMEIGDSFVVEEGAMKRTSAVGYAFAHTHAPKKFIFRREGDHYRCWRIA